MTRSLCAVTILLLTIAPESPATAQPSPRELFDAAVEADEGGRTEEALRAYDAAVEADPSARFAGRALARARALRAEMADPALEGLAELRAHYRAIGSEEALRRADGLLEVATSDVGRLAVLTWIANEHVLVTGSHADAVGHFLAAALLSEAPGGGVETALIAAVRAARTGDELRRVGDTIDAVQANRSDLDPRGVARARDEVNDAILRRRVRPASAVAPVALALLALVRRRWDRVRDAGFRGPAVIAYAFGAAAGLSYFWEEGYVLPFLVALPATIAVHVLARAAGPRDAAGLADRAASAVTIGAATFGAIYLVFDAFGQQAVFGL